MSPPAQTASQGVQQKKMTRAEEERMHAEELARQLEVDVQRHKEAGSKSRQLEQLREQQRVAELAMEGKRQELQRQQEEQQRKELLQQQQQMAEAMQRKQRAVEEERPQRQPSAPVDRLPPAPPPGPSRPLSFRPRSIDP